MLHRRVLSFTALAAVLALASCDDTQQPRTDFQVSDGSAFGGNGNPHFFFLSPLVPSPTYSGTFDATLLPYLSVRITGPFDNDGLATCGGPIIRTATQASGLEVSTDLQQYSYGWKTGDDHLTDGKVYRVCVFFTPPNLTAFALGFRDVKPGQGGGSVAEDPVYLFNNGSTIPIKFRVETGLLSAAYCVDGTVDPNNPNSYDCTAQILASNQTAYCDNTTCALTTGEITNAGSELFIVEKFGFGDTECTTANPPQDGETRWLDIDNPQYAGCVRVTVPNAGFAGFETRGTIGACFYEESGPHPLKPGQDEAIQLHIQFPTAPGTRTVFALPWEYAGIEGTCALAFPELAAASGSVTARARQYAARALRTAQHALNPWFAPPKAWAFHTGFGGSTTLKSGTTTGGLRLEDPAADVTAQPVSGATASLEGEEPQVFLLAWALPSQMTGTASSGSQTVPPGGTLLVNEGASVAVNVQVTDNGASGDNPRVLGTPRPAMGARVHFAADGGTEQPILSGPYGLATFNWTALDGGLHTITASGFGIGTTATGGAFDSFDANGSYNDLSAALGLGTLDFKVYVCDASQTPNLVDGVIGGNEYLSEPIPFTAKVSGGSTSATLYWSYDCGNLYFGLEVAGSEISNEIVLVFDNDGDGVAELGDDQWTLRRDSKTGKYTTADRFLTANCVGSKQATCGADDTSAGGSYDLSGGMVTYTGSKTVYEIAHRLTGDVGHDIQANLASGTTLGVYLQLQLGNGAQGNTQYPGFRQYLPIVIGPVVP
jgi:hypothetical protein